MTTMASAVSRLGRVLGRRRILSNLRRQTVNVTHRTQFHTSSLLNASIEISMPSLSPTMTEGTIVKWYKNEGDAVSPGDVICDIQTDKAVVSLDTEEEGIMAKILKAENTADIKVGTLIAIMVEEGDDWQNVEIPAQSEQSSAPAPAAPSVPTDTPKIIEQPVAASAPDQTRPPADLAQSLHASGVGPSVRKLVEEFGVPLSEVSGTGPQGRLMKSDVVKYIKLKNLQRQNLAVKESSETPSIQETTSITSATQPLPYFDDEEEFIDIPNTGMRTTIAKRLTLSKTTIPHSYVTMDIKVNPVIGLRKQLIEQGIKVSVNDFIIKAAALALKLVPQVNSVWSNDDINLLTSDEVCVAVATDNGLITPIVRNSTGLQVEQISEQVKDLANRARQNKLQLHEFQGGNFTISNLGMFGITEFSAVINPPQTAIMAVGSSRVVVGDGGKPESLMSVTLSYDARAIDLTEASHFLESFKSLMESPQILANKPSAVEISLID